MPSKSRIKVTESTGNVFRDLGFPAEEAEHLLIRADLLLQLQKAVAARRLTQAAVAKVLRITQPRVSDLLRGQLHLFSSDTLIDFLARLGIHVRVVVTTSRRSGPVWVPPPLADHRENGASASAGMPTSGASSFMGPAPSAVIIGRGR